MEREEVIQQCKGKICDMDNEFKDLTAGTLVNCSN